MKVWQKTAIITITLFILGVVGAGWTYRPIVDYYIDDPPSMVNFDYEPMKLEVMSRNRGKVDVSLLLIITVQNANISVQEMKPWIERNGTELKMHVFFRSEMENYRTAEVYIEPVDDPQNFTIRYSIVNISGFSIAGIISRLFLESHGLYATYVMYNRTSVNSYELVVD